MARYSLLSPCPREALNSVAELARRLRISRQAAHRTATGLELAGLLRYVPRRGDRRLRLASLTTDAVSLTYHFGRSAAD
jgi:DNA-binding MarR family transcriptional regulator